MNADRQAVERFHFLFLERLLRQSAPGLFVLKGGVNLRFFCGSPRYSEDMDLDVRPGRVSVATLKKNGYRILEDAAFVRSLSAAGIDGLDLNDPDKAKQTETTQRFRLGLVTSSGRRLPTKIEFSRRGVAGAEVIVARVDPEVARRHGRAAFVCEHYSDAAAAGQKLRALTGRALPQARDLFDLDLLASRGVDLRALFASLPADEQENAITQVLAIDFATYRDQVVEYLDEPARAWHDDRETFERLQESLLTQLAGP